MKKQIAVSLITTAMLLSTGCATKQDTGYLVGGGLGAATCFALTKNQGSSIRNLATLGCGALGAFAGGYIGNKLDEKDRLELELATKQALNTNGATTTNWKSATTEASAKVEVGKPFVKTEKTEIKTTTTVVSVPNLIRMEGQYVTLKGSNVRAAPSISSARVGFMPVDTEFSVAGRTGDWLLVSRKGVVVGYVSDALVTTKAVYEASKEREAMDKLAKATKAKEASKTAQAAPQAAPVALQIQSPNKLDEMTKAEAPELEELVNETKAVIDGAGGRNYLP